MKKVIFIMTLALGQFLNLSALTQDEIKVDINNIGSDRSLVPVKDVTVKPATGVLIVEGKLDKDAVIEIMDSTGDVVYGTINANNSSNSSVAKYSIPTLESDDYTIVISSTGAVAEGTFSVQ